MTLEELQRKPLTPLQTFALDMVWQRRVHWKVKGPWRVLVALDKEITAPVKALRRRRFIHYQWCRDHKKRCYVSLAIVTRLGLDAMTRRPQITVFEEPSVQAAECAKLKWWRQRVKKWTCAELATQLGYTENTVHNYERGFSRSSGISKPFSKNGWQRFKARCAQLDGVPVTKFNWGIK